MSAKACRCAAGRRRSPGSHAQSQSCTVPLDRGGPVGAGARSKAPCHRQPIVRRSAYGLPLSCSFSLPPDFSPRNRSRGATTRSLVVFLIAYVRQDLRTFLIILIAFATSVPKPKNL